MAESRVKIKASANEINKHFNENPSPYFNIKYFNGEKYYTGDDEKIITFETLIRHNEIGERSIERSSPYTLKSLEKNLKEKVEEYEKELNNKKIRVISGKCMGGINDTLIYEININYKGIEDVIDVNCSFNHKLEKNIWYVSSSKLDISIKDRYNIIEVISSNPPSIMSDVESKVYNIDLQEGITSTNFKELVEIEDQFSKSNNIKNKDNIYREITRCAYFLNNIDDENAKKTKNEKKINYPEWATKEIIELIKRWYEVQKNIDYQVVNNKNFEENEYDYEY